LWFGAALGLAACGSDPAPTPNDAGSVTDTPAADTPAADTPAADTPAAADVGAAADAPAAADVPGADAPAPTDVPTAPDVTTAPDVPTAMDVPSGMDAPVATDATAAPTFTQVYAIISSNCTPCHVPDTSGGLNMATRAAAHTNLLNGRVTAGSPAMSRLFCKVSGGPGCGSRMPLGRAPLSDADVRVIELWIAAGAPNN